jgi:hypothetical protein
MSTSVPIKHEPQPIPPMGLVPATMEEAVRLAELMASAKLVPAALQKSPADCLMVIQQAIRWGMDVFAVAQECSVIQGKLMHSGKLVAAVINARGGLAERLSFEYSGEGDDRAIVVSGRLSGEVEPREVVVRLRDARTANKVWQTQPDQQLMYHGSRVWARRHAPELMLGVYSPEEFDEPAPLSSAAKKPSPPKPNVLLPPHDPETGEITDHQQPSLQNLPTTASAGDSGGDQGTQGARPMMGVRTGGTAPQLAPGDAGAQASAPSETPQGAGADLTSDDLEAWDIALTGAAERGMAELGKAWDSVPGKAQQALKVALERRHKPRAKEVDSVPQS